MTLLSLAVAPFMAGSSFLMGRPVRAVARVSREIAAQMQSHVQQTLSGMPVVQAFAQEERAQERFLTFASARIRAEQRNTIVSGSGLIITLGNAAILWIGARHVPRLVDHGRGAYWWEGHDVRDVELRSLRSQVALVCRRLSCFPCRLPTT